MYSERAAVNADLGVLCGTLRVARELVNLHRSSDYHELIPTVAAARRWGSQDAAGAVRSRNVDQYVQSSPSRRLRQRVLREVALARIEEAEDQPLAARVDRRGVVEDRRPEVCHDGRTPAQPEACGPVGPQACGPSPPACSVCAQVGIDCQVARSACEAACSCGGVSAIENCIFDYCAMGGDTTAAEACAEANECEMSPSPSPPPLPPAPALRDTAVAETLVLVQCNVSP